MDGLIKMLKINFIFISFYKDQPHLNVELCILLIN